METKNLIRVNTATKIFKELDLKMSFKEKNEDFCEKKHIDYDRMEQIFYYNIYFEDSSFVLKIPLMSLIKQISCENIKN